MRKPRLLTLTLAVGGLLVGGCSADDEAPAAPPPAQAVDRYSVYANLVAREPALTGPPEIKAREADSLARNVCASDREAFSRYLDARPDRAGGLNTAILDRRTFIIAYCPDVLPDFDAAAEQACADAVDVVGRNCPGKFSTLS